MLIKINGSPLPPHFGKDIMKTLVDIDNIYVDGKIIEDHTLQFYGLHPNDDVQEAFDVALQQQIHNESAQAAMHVKAFFVNHIFDLQQLGQHMHDLMGMTS
jgi:hypothetical protein